MGDQAFNIEHIESKRIEINQGILGKNQQKGWMQPSPKLGLERFVNRDLSATEWCIIKGAKGTFFDNIV